MEKINNNIGEVFYYYSLANNQFFNIDLCGYTPPVPEYEVYRSKSYTNVIEYVMSGKGYIEESGKTYTVSEGDFYFLKYGISAHYYADKEDPYEKIWVNFSGGLIEQLVPIYHLDQDVIIRHCEDHTIKEIITDIHNTLIACPDGYGNEEHLRKCSVKIIEIFSIAMANETILNKTEVSTMADRIRKYIDTSIYEDITLESIAKYFHIHEVYVIRLFRKRFGITPVKYINRERIKIAQRMIAEEKMTFKEIATALKYSDGQYFSNRFRYETGMSPSEYRMKAREIHKPENPPIIAEQT